MKHLSNCVCLVRVNNRGTVKGMTLKPPDYHSRSSHMVSLRRTDISLMVTFRELTNILSSLLLFYFEHKIELFQHTPTQQEWKPWQKKNTNRHFFMTMFLFLIKQHIEHFFQQWWKKKFITLYCLIFTLYHNL